MGTLYSAIGLITCIVVWFLNSKFISDKLIEPIRKYPYTKFEKCNPPLGTMNGIGFTLYCGGRFDYNTNSQAWYLFFCFLIPLFPIGCYRATEVDSSGRGRSYKIYGHDKWRFWEVISIYISSFAWIGGVISIIALIASFF
ncbi:MAG: hypothetical protein Q4B21_02010 [Bacteroidia bacterium]|nr:hypothetical protein [Bacteroidia bacterium]